MPNENTLNSKKERYNTVTIPVYLAFRVRTSISIDKILCDLLSIKLGVTPGTMEGRKRIALWVQEEIDRCPLPCINKSNYISRKIITNLIGNKLRNSYLTYEARRRNERDN